MTPFPLVILAPDREYYRGSAESVTAPGQAGEFGVLANHIPMVAGLQPGVVLVREAGGKVLHVAVDGGMLGAGKDGVRILTGRASVCDTREQARRIVANFARVNPPPWPAAPGAGSP